MLTTELYRQASYKGTSTLYLVKRDGVVVGLIEKYRNTRTEHHPWKALFKTHVGPCGPEYDYLGGFYDSRSLCYGGVATRGHPAGRRADGLGVSTEVGGPGGVKRRGMFCNDRASPAPVRQRERGT